MNLKINIALVDDDSLFVEGLSALLSYNERFNVVYKTNNPLDFLEFLKTATVLPDVILVDLNMKPINGIELLDFINQNNINVKIIVISSLFTATMYGYMIKYSISAFLPKYTDKDEFYNAILEVSENKVYINEENQKLLNQYVKVKKVDSRNLNPAGLTDREIEVLKCVCNELSNKEIADKLFISVKTVESHKSKLMEKIGCKNGVGLVVYSILNGIYVMNISDI